MVSSRKANSARVRAVPVGLFGLQTKTTRVCSVTASAMAATSWRAPVRGTRRARAPASAVMVAYSGKVGQAWTTSLPGSAAMITPRRDHFETDGIEWVGEVHEGRGRKPVISQERID